MRALRFENGGLRLADVDTPHRGGEALVRVTTAGVCNTDLEIVRGYADFRGTLGHEFVGVVEDSPDRSQIGRRVVGEINAGCGECELCDAGDARHCPNRTVLGIVGRDGAFAEYLTLPPRNLLAVPEAVSDRQAVFTEPLAAACEILDQVKIAPEHRVAVLGDGKLGQLIARVLATTGCELKTVELNRLEVDPARRFDFVVEASGAEGGLNLALDLVRPRGTVILKSTFHGPARLNTSRIVVDEISVVGSRCGRFSRALELLERGAVNPEPLVAAEYSLADGLAAMQHAASAGTLKVLLKP
jgi:threonine dehydrogenase-like Zn-dependent dehydrogenase